jgi:hypothetical protein
LSPIVRGDENHGVRLQARGCARRLRRDQGRRRVTGHNLQYLRGLLRGERRIAREQLRRVAQGNVKRTDRLLRDAHPSPRF